VPSDVWPSDTTKSAVMKATPEIFKFERVTSGVSAVLYEAVRQWDLYKLEGFASMTAYAEGKLGVIGKANNAAYARAGKAVWTYYPATAQRAIESLVGAKGFTGVNLTDLPNVPGVGLLRELPAALERTKLSDRAALLERVGGGQMSHSDLRRQGRKKAAKTHCNAGSAVAPAKVTTDEEHLPEGFTRADIFNDVGDLDHAAGALREATSTLDSLRAGWSEHSAPDVLPVLPTLEAILVGLKAAAAKLDEITPRSICAACRGEAERCKACRKMGWLPRKSALAPLRKTQSSKTAGKKVASPKQKNKKVSRRRG